MVTVISGKIYCMKQVNSSHYDFIAYMHSARWSCYYIQIYHTLSLKPASVMEIGPGDGLFGWYMEKNGVDYTSVDCADDLQCDVQASLGYERLPFDDDSFDVVCAFQVLEHIPFDKFEDALSELQRVTKKHVFLDIPQYGFHVKFALKLPLVKNIECHFVLPRPIKHIFDGQHYWEIGKKNYSSLRIRKSISKFFNINKEFSIYKNPKERFYLLEKVSKNI